MYIYWTCYLRNWAMQYCTYHQYFLIIFLASKSIVIQAMMEEQKFDRKYTIVPIEGMEVFNFVFLKENWTIFRQSKRTLPRWHGMVIQQPKICSEQKRFLYLYRYNVNRNQMKKKLQLTLARRFQLIERGFLLRLKEDNCKSAFDSMNVQISFSGSDDDLGGNSDGIELEGTAEVLHN